jgi:type III secretion system FlhB-like substrate exporter
MLDVGATIPRELYEVVAAIYCQILNTATKNEIKTGKDADRK